MVSQSQRHQSRTKTLTTITITCIAVLLYYCITYFYYLHTVSRIRIRIYVMNSWNKTSSFFHYMCRTTWEKGMSYPLCMYHGPHGKTTAKNSKVKTDSDTMQTCFSTWARELQYLQIFFHWIEKLHCIHAEIWILGLQAHYVNPTPALRQAIPTCVQQVGLTRIATFWNALQAHIKICLPEFWVANCLPVW